MYFIGIRSLFAFILLIIQHHDYVMYWCGVHWVLCGRFGLVERGSSVGRMPDSQSTEPGFEPRCYRFEVWAFSFTSRRLSRLSCINEYLAIDSGGNVSE